MAALVSWGGPGFERHLKQYVDVIGWLMIVAIVAAYFLLRH